MSIYFVENRQTVGLNMSDFDEVGPKKISEIQHEIKSRSDFCRDEESITGRDLVSYLGNGITIYGLSETGALLGVLNFNINTNSEDSVKFIYIYGICTPLPSTGFGTKLITSIKNFARSNHISQIKLVCYDEKVMKFYAKNEFRVINSTTLYDSDDDEDKVKYEMTYIRESGGKRKRKSMRKRKSIKKRKSIRKRKSMRK